MTPIVNAHSFIYKRQCYNYTNYEQAISMLHSGAVLYCGLIQMMQHDLAINFSYCA